MQTGNDDPFDALLTLPVGTPDVHRSIVLPTYINNPVLDTDGLWMFGEGDIANGIPVLQNVTVLYYIPEPGCLAMIVIVWPLLRRGERRATIARG